MLLFTGGVVILAAVSLRWRRVAVPAAWLAWMATFYLLAGVVLLPEANAFKSARPFCDEVNTYVDDTQQIRGYRSWKWRAEYPFYLGRPLPVLRSEAQLARYWEQPDEVFLIVEDLHPEMDGARQVVGEAEPLIEGRVGHKRVLLFSNRGRAAER